MYNPIMQTYLSYSEAKELVRPLAIKNSRKWFSLHPKPCGIPGNPCAYYTKSGEWLGWGDFLSTNNPSSKKNRFLSYGEAKAFCHRAEIRTKEEYREIVKFGVMDLPLSPEKYYRSQDIKFSWKEMLASRFLTKEEFIKFLVDNGMTKITVREWSKYSKESRPYFIPSNPYKAYGLSFKELNGLLADYKNANKQ